MRAIQNYESGERNISNDIIMMLNEKFNINIHWLYTGNGSMFLEEKKEENKYQWLNSLLDRLPEEEVKRIELEAQKIFEKQHSKEMNVKYSKNVG